MPKLRFTATPNVHHYHDIPDWHHGDEREVGEEQAKHLLEAFPEHFALVKAETKAVDLPADNRMERRPRGNR